MAWIKPQFRRGEVDRAGKTLRDNPDDAAARDYALTVINNWRSSHGYPLNSIRATLNIRAAKVDQDATVAQRLKRMASIRVKLERNPNMALSQVQDLGGCRAILKTVDHVDRLVAVYEKASAKNPHTRPELIKKYDYIAAPKPDGYRSVHLIFKFRSGTSSTSVWTGHRIEVQMRSRLQHAWATSVETVDMFTSQALKTGGGADSWRRFFQLMSSYIALGEKRPLCPECPTDFSVLRTELRHLAQMLNVVTQLEGWSAALQRALPQHLPEGVNVYLLRLDTVKRLIRVDPFPDKESAKASNEYLEAEKTTLSNPGYQAVLASAQSIKALRAAFPNFFADTTVFLQQVRGAIRL